MKRAVYAAIAGNLAIAVTKFIAAAISGSSAMLAEGIHSLVDTGNGGLLLIGMKRSRKPPHEKHPFGHARELYFYSLIVAVLIFGVGGGISIYEGILHILHPAETGDPTLNYIVIGIAVVFEGASWWVALKTFRSIKGRRSFWEEIRRSKDPTTFTVLFEDSAALAGLVFAFLGIYFGHALDIPELDGVASIFIGTILCLVASVLIIESKGLLVGESVNPEVRESIGRLIEEDDSIEKVIRMMTMQLGPEEAILNLDLKFREGLTTEQLEVAVDRIEKSIRGKHPEIKYVTIEVESLGRAR